MQMRSRKWVKLDTFNADKEGLCHSYIHTFPYLTLNYSTLTMPGKVRLQERFLASIHPAPTVSAKDIDIW